MLLCCCIFQYATSARSWSIRLLIDCVHRMKKNNSDSQSFYYESPATETHKYLSILILCFCFSCMYDMWFASFGLVVFSEHCSLHWALYRALRNILKSKINSNISFSFGSNWKNGLTGRYSERQQKWGLIYFGTPCILCIWTKSYHEKYTCIKKQ